MSQVANQLNSICIIRLSSIGDITHMIPIIQTLKYYLPHANLTWIIGKTEYSLVKNIKGVDFIVIDKNNFRLSLKKLRLINKDKVYDVLLHMQVSLRSNIISLYVNSIRKIGFDSPNSKNFHSLFINERIRPKPRIHVLDTFFYFLKEIGIDNKYLDYEINISEAKKIINKKYIVFNPFTSSRRFNYREWDIDNYKVIVKYINEKYSIDSIIIGGKSDYEIRKSAEFNNINNVTNMVGSTSLEQAYNIIKNSELYIGSDSGTMHMASLLAKPIIGLFATSNPFRTGPYRNMKYIINKYPEALIKFNKETEDSVKWGKRVRNKKAMSLIRIEDVTKNIDAILKL